MAEKKKGLFGWFSSDEEETAEPENDLAMSDDELTAFLTQDGDFSDDEDADERFCPCGVVINPEWRFCPMCGKRFGEKPERFCRNCGEEAEENWDYCPKCGHLITEEN